VRGQISFIHVLRGVAALLVVWAHLGAYWLFTVGGTSALQDLWRTTVAEPLHLYQDGGYLGVVLFFLISGYIVTHASLSETRTSFVTKRVLRIFPPLAFALAVLWSLMHLMPALGVPMSAFPGGPPGRWLQSLLLLDFLTPGTRVLSVTWTLASEMVFYVMVLAAIAVQRSRPLATTLVMAAGWAVACWLVVASAFGLPPTPEAAGILMLVGVLLVGRCTYLVHARLVAPAAGVALAAVVGVLVAVFQEAWSPGFLLDRAGTPGEPVVAYAMAVGIFVGMLVWSPGRAARPLAWLGDISYSLYLLHMPVGFAVLGVLHRFDAPSSLATILGTTASLAAAHVSYRLVERPSQRFARHLLRSRPVPAVAAPVTTPRGTGSTPRSPAG
jgi:peptidoglycan/LPS O-acetylase OafA/YrhL